MNTGRPSDILYPVLNSWFLKERSFNTAPAKIYHEVDVQREFNVVLFFFSLSELYLDLVIQNDRRKTRFSFSSKYGQIWRGSIKADVTSYHYQFLCY